MKAILVAAGKGGLGKTTVSIGLSGELAKYSPGTSASASADRWLRITLHDLDPQAGATLMLGHSPVEEPSGAEPVTVANDRTGAMFRLARGGHKLAHARIPDVLRLLDGYGAEDDIHIIDAPPLLGDQTAAALQRADLVVVPHMLTLSSLTGIAGIEQLCQSLDLNVPIRRVVVMPKSRRSISAEVRAFAAENYPGVRPYETELPEDVAVVEAEASGVPVTWLRRTRSAAAYRHLAQEILADLGMNVNVENR